MAEACAALGTGCRELPPAAGEVALQFWVPPAAGAAARAVLAALGRVDGPEREDPAWREAMRAFHRPVRVGDVLLVRPPWTEPEPGLLDVVIDPGMAFGTGQHDTTRGCLELMLGLPRGPLVDVGTGSGVLAIAARRLGFDPVWALDHDPFAVEATLVNARQNAVGLTVACRDLTRDRLPHAPVMLANLTREVLLLLARAVAQAPPEHAVLSGLRPFEVPGVLEAFVPLGLVERDRREGAEWASVLLGRA
jgi:ribosomal protein L11 methyltransferase